MTSCRPTPGQKINRILCFEVPSSTEWQTPTPDNAFVPNCFVDITDTLKHKLNALKAYEGEMIDWPHSRSFKALEHLARWRGTSSGVEAAEALMISREVIH